MYVSNIKIRHAAPARTPANTSIPAYMSFVIRPLILPASKIPTIVTPASTSVHTDGIHLYMNPNAQSRNWSSTTQAFRWNRMKIANTNVTSRERIMDAIYSSATRLSSFTTNIRFAIAIFLLTDLSTSFAIAEKPFETLFNRITNRTAITIAIPVPPIQPDFFLRKRIWEITAITSAGTAVTISETLTWNALKQQNNTLTDAKKVSTIRIAR